MLGPDAACVLWIAGFLAVYAECVRPGWVIPGVLGSAAVVAGAYSLYRLSPTRDGVVALAAAAVLFAIEARWNMRLICGGAGTFVLGVGFWYLLPAPYTISRPLAISGAILLGEVTTVLCSSASRARRNKKSDMASAP